MYTYAWSFAMLLFFKIKRAKSFFLSFLKGETMTKFLLIIAILIALSSKSDATGVTSRLQVILPKSLRQDSSIEHREALFGLPPYGGSIQQNVYYADSKLCDPSVDYSRGGYPTRDTDETGEMTPWKSPFILMVDRGDCTFVNKVRIAQHAGAAGVLIADNTCLCTAVTCQNEDGGRQCETKEPIMADDGSGADITIPSFLLFKQDADPLKKAIMKDTVVRVEMSWALPRPDDRVEYQLWTTPKDEIAVPLQRNFREVAQALGSHAQFTPHMYIYDGVLSGCMDDEGDDECYNLCTNSGRYCSTDPDDDLDSGISGADVVKESLRRICIWKEYGSKDGIGMPWWNYVDEFLARCDTVEYFTNDECIKDAMNHAGVDFDVIEKCMDDSGGLEGKKPNTLLDDELAAKEETGVVILPSFYVNNAPLRGALTTGEVFEAICSGYASGSQPDACKNCMQCDDLVSCVSIGHCPGAKGYADSGVSMQTFAATVLGLSVFFGILGLIQWQRSQRQMRDQVRGILAEYMPIDKNQNVESVGIPDDDEDEDIILPDVS